MTAHPLFRRGVLWLLAALLLGSAGARAAQPACRPTLRAALDEYGSFFSAENQPGGDGIDLAIVTELARRLGCRPEIRVESVVRIMPLLAMGESDLAAHKYASPERARIAWLVPYVRQHNVLLVRKDGPAPGVTAFLANPHWRLGIGKGWQFGQTRFSDLVAQLRAQGRLIEVADTRQLFALLRANRVQAVIASPPVYQHMLSATMLQQYRAEDLVPEVNMPALNLMLSRATVDRTLLTAVIAALQAMRRDGTLLRILSHYVGTQEASSMLLPFTSIITK